MPKWFFGFPRAKLCLLTKQDFPGDITRPPEKERRLTFSSLATRTSVQSFSISSMVRIITMLCHRSGDSKCLPNLGRETESLQQEGSRHQSPTAEPELQAGKCGEGLVHITCCLLFQGPRGTGLGWGRVKGPRSDSARDLELTPCPNEAFPKPHFPSIDSVIQSQTPTQGHILV